MSKIKLLPTDVHVDDLGESLGDFYDRIPVRTWNAIDTAERDRIETKTRIAASKFYEKRRNELSLQN